MYCNKTYIDERHEQRKEFGIAGRIATGLF
jgi:hypothetical protein